MARKQAVLRIPGPPTDENRDGGKVYVLTEMSAVKAEKWGQRALLALTRSRVEIPEDIVQLGFAGVALIGFHALSGVQFEELEPLLDEMMECVQIETSPGILRAPHADEDFEEVATLLKVRREVFELHAGFWMAAAKLRLEAIRAAAGTVTDQT